MKDYLQYGSGFAHSPSFLSFDASPTLRFERLPLVGRLYTRNAQRFPAEIHFGDIVRGLPVPEARFKGVYCSHILEHLTLGDFRIALRNTQRYLRPGGVFRLVMPDLEHYARTYLADGSADASFGFLRSLHMRLEVPRKGFRGFLVEFLGKEQHQWMWDYRSAERELREAGFTDIRRAQFGDSADPVFSELEVEGRWTNCLGIECRRPGA